MTSSSHPDGAEDDLDGHHHHAIIVCDGDGNVVHAGGELDELLGVNDLSHHRQLASLLIPEDGRPTLPSPGEARTLAVRRRAGSRKQLMSSHPMQVPGPADDAIDLTAYVISQSPATARDPAIDPGIAAVLSHELRTPITTIYAGSQMLLARRRMSEESQREMLADIQLEADRLYRLVEDLLVANVGKGGIEVVPEPVLLQRSLPRVVAMEAARWPHVSFVTTLASGLPAVRADELYLEHIVRDLLANAGSFSEHQATVRLDARQAGDAVEVRVLDEGPGIDARASETLFQPFRGATPEGGGRPGPGLGLYVCKLLVEAMGGRIWARNRPVAGSEFGFSLVPYREESEEPRTGVRQAAG
jgi:signal transduction histidine kinase